MARAHETEHATEIAAIYFQRTRICLWLGVVFFSLFSLLDFIACRPYFPLFASYRLIYVLLLLLSLLLINSPILRPCTRWFMDGALILGAGVIALMTVHLGGFSSGYYVGILLMIAGGFSVLPLTARQALTIGGCMYLVYVLTVFLGARPRSASDYYFLINNSFFFFALVLATSFQCLDDIRTLGKALAAQSRLKALKEELRHYTGNLEQLVKRRVELLAESDLKFLDLYNAILDLVVLIDPGGVIRMVNLRGAALFRRPAAELIGGRLIDHMPAQSREAFTHQVLERLQRGEAVRAVQMQLIDGLDRALEVEISGNRVQLPEGDLLHQLIIRDITENKEMARQVLQSNQLLDTSRQAAIFGLARLAECRDDTTGSHLLRIRQYTRILAEDLAQTPEYGESVTPAFIEDLCLSSILHDIGKVGIPDAILLKPDRLTAEEFEAMKLHCEYGSAALSSADEEGDSFSFLRTGREITRFHHERWDGSGYPYGLHGPAIPLSARIVALADVYDALTSPRSYKEAFSHEQARLLILKENGRGFDPLVVNAFLRREQEFKMTRDMLMGPAFEEKA